MTSYKDHYLDMLNATTKYTSVMGVTRAACKHDILLDIEYMFPSGNMSYMLLLASYTTGDSH
jgi:hypothetical protein